MLIEQINDYLIIWDDEFTPNFIKQNQNEKDITDQVEIIEQKLLPEATCTSK